MFQQFSSASKPVKKPVLCLLDSKLRCWIQIQQPVRSSSSSKAINQLQWFIASLEAEIRLSDFPKCFTDLLCAKHTPPSPALYFSFCLWSIIFGLHWKLVLQRNLPTRTTSHLDCGCSCQSQCNSRNTRQKVQHYGANSVSCLRQQCGHQLTNGKLKNEKIKKLHKVAGQRTLKYLLLHKLQLSSGERTELMTGVHLISGV